MPTLQVIEPMLYFLAQQKMKLEDVFRSTEDSFNETPDMHRVWALMLAATVIVVLLIAFNYKRKREVRPKTLNHQGKLLKEVLKQLPIRSGEIKQLKLLAEQEECSSPLVMILCPSLLAKGIRNRTADRKVLGRVARKVGASLKA